MNRKEFLLFSGSIILANVYNLLGCVDISDKMDDSDDSIRRFDVPPTADNIKRFTDAVNYYNFGTVPFDGYEPDVSLTEASDAIGYMCEWQSGMASAYDVDSNFGTETASMIPLSDDDMTIAHKTLPLGTIVKIYWNGKTIMAKVTDRGPYVEGRDIDLSAGACRALSGMSPMAWGVREVWYKIVRF